MSGRVGKRDLDVLRDELSGRDIAIVRQVADLRLMTAGQIEAVHFPTTVHASGEAGGRAARRVLERLTRDRLLRRLDRRIGGLRAGSASFVYCLDVVGHRLLQSDSARPGGREPSLGFADHTLAIAQLVVDLTTAARAGECEVVALQPEPWCWRRHSGGLAHSTVLRPDLYVSLDSEGYELRWFVEIDRGTEHLPTLLKKCRAYDAYYRSGVEQAAHGVFPRVVWLVSSERRSRQLRTAIDHDGALAGAMFIVKEQSEAVAVLTNQEPKGGAE